jgi:hypothetical protein
MRGLGDKQTVSVIPRLKKQSGTLPERQTVNGERQTGGTKALTALFFFDLLELAQ